ncbi:MAG: bifunctional 23S rRNA (guanine(2069)-N(7))-methyltransferase RlmK/23S rRNA (guanine(2445)-N(2))-methyltransferase RlmL [Magnetococcales bacterium]|nr:bifunctional 23S rRNA (guanine(2069)-N(7))-methyltransferase RlmK/23S rRNA (guanine(2445)-N(2))-methyltransferase RlmL [Magnetococcales bacterium]
MEFSYFATTAKGVEPLLAKEVTQLAGRAVRLAHGGVTFRGPLEIGYRVCLWSRLANRVILNLQRLAANDHHTLYDGVRQIDWESHISPSGSLAVDFIGTNASIIHSAFGGQRVKDGVVDRLRERFGSRPNVDVANPDVRIQCRLTGDSAWLGIDLAGESLHRRGYRSGGGAAPLKETLAAAILWSADWPVLAKERWPFLDPMCGSGTLVIEAALMAGDIAPGLLRKQFGFNRWLGHQPVQWQNLVQEALSRKETGRISGIQGYDRDPAAVEMTRRNLQLAGIERFVQVEVRDIATLSPPFAKGLLAVNPPYGERLGDRHGVEALYQQLATTLQGFQGWRIALFSAATSLGDDVTPGAQTSQLFNGAIPCTLWLSGFGVTLNKTPTVLPATKPLPPRPPVLPDPYSLAPGPGAEMLLNRLQKNWKHWRRWADKRQISCFRLYDADIPEYAVAVDRYEDWVSLQEYRAPAEVDPMKANQRLADALWAVPQALQIPPENMVFKQRQRAKGGEQYPKRDERREFLTVHEGGLRFLVNLHDYLDTGLFLDHRLTRSMIRQLANGRRFLNLFGYTGTATVYAADGGATTTTTVDLSNTYLDWAWRNLAINRLDAPRHSMVRADCLAWLNQQKESFDLIFLDPPTFSNSKAMDSTFILQRDYENLLTKCMQLLAPQGILIFSCNYRKFRMNQELVPADWSFTDITKETTPEDFSRSPRIHRCWRLQRP